MQKQDDEAAYQAIFQHSSLGIIVADEEGIITQVNAYANELFGYEKTELVGEKIEILVPERLMAQHRKHKARFYENQSPKSMRFGRHLWALKKDKTEFPIDMSLTLYELNGRKQFISFISDVTEWEKIKEELKTLNAELEERVKERTSELSQAIMELQQIDDDLEKEIEQRKKVEEELRQAFERQKELNELKSRFVSMASHEFRTPLSGILTSVALISRYREPGDEDKRNKHINVIKQAVYNLTNILNEFLSLDKMEQDGIACHPSLISIVDFVSELVDEKHTLYEQEQRIIYEHKGKNDLIKLDKDILRNILINLISNAMKYSLPDKKIYLKTELKGTTLRIVIQDNGIGIPEADQKHLFERFFRAQNALTIQGTGLGLNIVKKYLNLMGGSIHFTSQENRGTIFTVKIPYEKNSTN